MMLKCVWENRFYRKVQQQNVHNLRRNNTDYVQISFVFCSGQVKPMNSKHQPTKAKRLPFMQIIHIYGIIYGNLSYIP
jgi:hypothetical protein